MTTPTVTSITPDIVRTTGRARAVIRGTGFRLPPEPEPEEYGGKEQITVSVKVDGIDCPWAAAADSTEIHCVLPSYRGTPGALPLAADVRVSNLDDSGAEIAGEQAVAVAALTYKRIELPELTHLQDIIGVLVRAMQVHLTPEVDISSSAIYDDDVLDETRYEGRLPMFELVGPKLVRSDGTYQLIHNKYIDDPDDDEKYIRRIRGVVVDIEFDVRCVTKYARELYGLTDAWLKVWRDIPWLEVNGDKYEIEIPWGQEPRLETKPKWSDLSSFRSQLVIKGVHIDADDDTIVERGWKIADNEEHIKTEITRHD